MIYRRQFLLGISALIAAPAIVRAEALMPVRSLIIEPAVSDPLIRGIRWQSFPMGAPCPSEFCQGSIGPESGRGVLKPTSYFLERLEKHKAHWANTYWQAMN